MTAPKRDGRPPIERARELVKLAPYPFHERSSEGLTALVFAMRVVEAAERYTGGDFRALPELRDAVAAMRVGYVTR